MIGHHEPPAGHFPASRFGRARSGTPLTAERHTPPMRSLPLLLLACLGAAHAAATPTEDPGAMARLRIEASDNGYLAWADNLLAGPIEVRLEVTGGAPPPSQPLLPARAGVPAAGSTLVARLQAPGGRDGWLRLRLRGVPGSSNARPRDVAYRLPLAQAQACVDQGFEGEFSHRNPENRYALDFAAAVGTPVLAARGGVVMQAQGHFRGHGLDPVRDAARANFIRVLHEDGSMALYAHLAEGGVLVDIGQRVEAGQPIGLSGNTGYSTAPHLHFAVQVNRGMQLEAIPFRMPAVQADGGAAAPAAAQATSWSSAEGSTSSRHCGSFSSMPTERR